MIQYRNLLGVSVTTIYETFFRCLFGLCHSHEAKLGHVSKHVS